MKTCDYNFDLPEHLIAQFPPEKRGQSRLMTLDRITGERTHRKVTQLPDILCAQRFEGGSGERPLLVFNDTKVRKARIIGKSSKTGAEAEFLLLESTNTSNSNTRFLTSNHVSSIWRAISRHMQRKKEGSIYIFFDNKGNETARATIVGFDGELLLEFDRVIDDDWFDKNGHVPLPPYIKRKDAPDDAQRYQTVYAKQTGSVASPTAGLHFTGELLDELADCGIESAFVTLHVGLGTFLPVRSENVEDHSMHKEHFIITEDNAAMIEKAIAQERKIIAVGTTSLRCLESAFCNESLLRGWQSTSIFIYPPYKFKIVDALFTNFHTPLSTLLMLVSAFTDGTFDGRQLILESYAEAVRLGYRFFSYGDAMLIY